MSKIWCVDYTKATNTPPPKWPMLTLKLQAKDYKLTFQSKVKTKVFSKLNTLDLSLMQSHFRVQPNYSVEVVLSLGL